MAAAGSSGTVEMELAKSQIITVNPATVFDLLGGMSPSPEESGLYKFSMQLKMAEVSSKTEAVSSEEKLAQEKVKTVLKNKMGQMSEEKLKVHFTLADGERHDGCRYAIQGFYLGAKCDLIKSVLELDPDAKIKLEFNPIQAIHVVFAGQLQMHEVVSATMSKSLPSSASQPLTSSQSSFDSQDDDNIANELGFDCVAKLDSQEWENVFDGIWREDRESVAKATLSITIHADKINI